MKITKIIILKMLILFVFILVGVVYNGNLAEAKTLERSCDYTIGYNCCGGSYPGDWKRPVYGNVSVDTTVSMVGGDRTTVSDCSYVTLIDYSR